MRLTVTALRFDENGSGEKTAAEYDARCADDGKTLTLTYETADESRLCTVLSFRKADPCVVNMRQTGDAETEMRFAPGAVCTGEYRVRGVGVLPFTLTARRVENAFPDGALRLDYDMTIGGARQRNVLTITRN